MAGKVPSNTVCKQLVHQADLFATWLRFGISSFADSVKTAFSLVPLMKGADQPIEPCISTAVKDNHLPRWSLEVDTRPGKEGSRNRGNVQLFHLEEDLGEKKNLAEEELPRVHRMLDALSRSSSLAEAHGARSKRMMSR